MSKNAFITGIGGQDGSYLAELLVEKGYNVFGIIRRNSIAEHQWSRLDHINDKVHVDYGDVTDAANLNKLLKSIQPDEIYNLAAQSHVRISFDIPSFTLQTNALGVLNMLEAYRLNCPGARFYQASSSEMFGNSVDPDGYQRETTLMTPASPYGCAKLCAYSLVRNYRKSYKLFACNGILFNHESPRRGSNFVTSKVIKAAVRIKMKKQLELSLGNLDSYRDWGHSKDYVRAMNMILNHSIADDFVVATGYTHSVRELCDYVFKKLELDYKDYVVQGEKYVRPEELKYLKGDASKARNILKWEPTISFNEILDEMILHFQKVENAISR